MKLAVLAFVLAAGVSAQEIRLDAGPRHGRQHVELLEDSFTVEAGKPQEVELRFRVAPNLHINSHTPKDELLLPTTLKFEGGAVAGEDYPKGHPFRLAIGEGETLDVYEGEFRIRLHLLAPRGESAVVGQLRYQACDTASCLPPQVLPVHLVVLGK